VSTNGDRWCLDMNDGEVVVLHIGNEPSGGHETRTPLAVFLEERVGKPEHAALLQVLGQSRDEVEDQLGEAEVDDQPTAGGVTAEPATKVSSPGSEASEPSPER
jgi:hypothetical protein